MKSTIKKTAIFMIIALMLTGTVFAQERTRPQRENSMVNIEGTLKLERGTIALQSGDNVYFVPGLNRYTGFINGIREGNTVAVEGYSRGNTIHPVKLTVEGRTYDLIGTREAPGTRENPAFGRDRFEQRGQKSWQGRNFAPAPRYAPGGCCR
jgi:hypothetical protein